MATTPQGKGPDEERPPEADAAEPVVWDTYKRDLEAQGNDEDAQYLQYLLRANPKEVETKGDFKHVSFDVFQRLSDYTSGYNAQTGEQTSWIFNALMEEPGRRMDPKKGIEVATEAAMPPPDALREIAEYETGGGDPYFIVRWKHEVNGIPVEQDYIQVLINGNTEKEFALHRKWHDIDTKASQR